MATTSNVRLSPSGPDLPDEIVSGWNVVRRLSDLPAPSGGFHTLDSGGWLFAAPLSLGSNGILVPSGVNVVLQGFGDDSILSSSAANVIDFASGSEFTANALSVSAPASVAYRINNSNLQLAQLYGCIARALTGFRHETGIASLFGCKHTGNGQGVSGTGLISALANVDDATLVSDFISQDGVTGISKTAAGYLCVDSGGTLQRLTTGANLAGTQHASLDGLRIANITADAVIGSGAGLTSVFLSDLVIESVGDCIDWSVAIPSGELAIMGVRATTFTNALVGFTAATARVNLRQCSFGAGLASETAIVP